ncbi:MAG: YbaK/EbsC family protein [Alphaproteobacteria bacterium]|nr:YbaK/EbsC family protein [Alphaproteobacteria bacterium]
MSIAPKLRQYLDDQNVEYDVIAHVPTHSALQSALASHVPAAQIAKGVLLDTDEGYLLAVLPANHKIMLADLTAEFGHRPQLVPEEALDRIFPDCAMGAVPPMGPGYDVPMIVDDSLDQQTDIYLEAGDHESLIHLTHDEFARLTSKARHAQFSAHEALLH